MKYLSILLIVLASCSTQPKEHISISNNVEYIGTEDNHRLFTVYQSNELNLIAIDVSQIPIQPSYKHIFYMEADCNIYTSKCDLKNIVSVNGNY